MKELVLIAHNLRSTHNVGSLLRTAEGLGLNHVYLSGYTPYPKQAEDSRLPHLVDKLDRQIQKTSLGAEKLIANSHIEDTETLIAELKDKNYQIVGLEQTKHSISLNRFKSEDKLALIVGREVEGIEESVLSLCDQIIEIPMLGQKESFNVVQAAAMSLFYLQFCQ
jgi:23S rRNA (guanosine2251-2'-O)-methyltransferase